MIAQADGGGRSILPIALRPGWPRLPRLSNLALVTTGRRLPVAAPLGSEVRLGSDVRRALPPLGLAGANRRRFAAARRRTLGRTLLWLCRGRDPLSMLAP
jgi:hypothetical protein